MPTLHLYYKFNFSSSSACFIRRLLPIGSCGPERSTDNLIYVSLENGMDEWHQKFSVLILPILIPWTSLISWTTRTRKTTDGINETTTMSASWTLLYSRFRQSRRVHGLFFVREPDTLALQTIPRLSLSLLSVVFDGQHRCIDSDANHFSR